MHFRDPKMHPSATVVVVGWSQQACVLCILKCTLGSAASPDCQTDGIQSATKRKGKKKKGSAAGVVNFPFLVKFEVSPTWRRFSPSAHLPRAELAFPRVRGPYPARALKEKCFSRGLSQLFFYYFGDGCGGQAHCWSILTLGSPGKIKFPRPNSHLRARAPILRLLYSPA